MGTFGAGGRDDRRRLRSAQEFRHRSAQHGQGSQQQKKDQDDLDDQFRSPFVMSQSILAPEGALFDQVQGIFSKVQA